MRRVAAWGILICIMVFGLFIFYQTEENYIRYTDIIRSLRLTIKDVKIGNSDETTKLEFTGLIENSLADKMVFESADFFIHGNARYLGVYFLADQPVIIPQGRERRIPLEAILDPAYRKLFLGEEKKGSVTLNISGHATIQIQVGRAEIEVGIPFNGTLTVGGGEEG